jgi:hypothetical protein
MSDVAKYSPTFICGHRGSGSELLISELDYHPELLVFPDESKFFYVFYPIMLNNNISVEEKLHQIKTTILEYTKGQFLHSYNANRDYFDYDEFVNSFAHQVLPDDSWEGYLLSILQAYADATPQPKDHLKRWVERSTSSEIYAQDIVEKFPTSKFIHNIRDPRDTYAVLKSRWQKKLRYLSDTPSLEALMQSCITRYKLGFEIGIKNYSLLGENQYMFSRYEDVVTDKVTSLSEIAKFLDIDESEFTGNPTFCGLPWKDDDLRGVGNSIEMGDWEKTLDNHEAALLEFHFGDLIKFFDYELQFSENERIKAATMHYRWQNYTSAQKADLSLTEKSDF